MLTGDELSATLVDQERAAGRHRARQAGGESRRIPAGRVPRRRRHAARDRPRAARRRGADLTASIVADKLELFAAPDRKLSLSGKATVANDGPRGALSIDGKFVVDHALFDLPEQSAPHLSDDVVIVGPEGTVRGDVQTGTAAAKPQKVENKPAPSLRRARTSTSASATISASRGTARISACAARSGDERAGRAAARSATCA
jgi:translocation and assembly module TamB